MTIGEQINRLERDLNRTRRRVQLLLIGLMLCVGVIALTTWGLGPQAVASQASRVRFNAVAARRFVLEDDEGEMRGALAVIEGDPALVLYDGAGEPTAWLEAENEEVCLTFADRKTTRLTLGYNEKGPMLFMYDKKGTPVLALPR